MARGRREVRLTGPARQDISEVMEWTVLKFGAKAALRYDALIKQALKDIGAEPDRVGSKARPDAMIEGARIYHLEFSRDRVSGPCVKNPRHFLLYRTREDGVIEVARVLHDMRDLARHLPDDYRRREDGD
ncbi:MAG: type II toxin-antitoxin system RelE/ParE family toxin [Acidobacteria bacterium]|nr:type II toxin-antitoxin system RelE/ParE family toxin [Acidobacteriota bacterium]